MLGDFDLVEYTATSNATSSIALFIVFMYLVNIILLNLLIAIMGDIFDQIQEKARAQFLYSKAKLILEFEDIMSEEDLKSNEMFPTWLQVLKSTASENGNADDSWVGKLRAIKKSIVNVGDEVDKKVDNLAAGLKADNAELKAKVDKKVDDLAAELKADNAELKAANAELKDLLLEVLAKKK